MQQNLIVIGQCGRPYGVKGWFHVQSFTADAKNILNYPNWTLLTPQGKQKPVKLQGIRGHGNHFIAKIQGIDSPEEAKSVGLFSIAIAPEELPKLNENQYYWVELIGLRAILPNGQGLGTVSQLFETGANDVIVIQTASGKELLVPYIDEVVLEVNLNDGTMILDWDPAERLSHD